MDPQETLQRYSNSLKHVCSYIFISLFLVLLLNVTPLKLNQFKKGVSTTLVICILAFALYTIFDTSYPIVTTLRSNIFDKKWNNMKVSLSYNIVLAVFIVILIIILLTQLSSNNISDRV